MKKLVAAVLTGVLVAGTLSTGVYAKDDDKTITVAASAVSYTHLDVYKRQGPGCVRGCPDTSAGGKICPRKDEVSV